MTDRKGKKPKQHHHSEAAMHHADKPGEGAKKRSKIKDPQAKVATVMSEWKRGTLHSGKSDKPVKSKAQALAIAMHESGQSKKK